VAIAAGLALALVDEALVLLAPRMQETFLASRASGLVRLAFAAAVVLGPAFAVARARRAPSPAEAWALAVLVLERTAASASHAPWAPGGHEAAREALVAAASAVRGGVPVGGLVAFALALALAAVAGWSASAAHFPRALPKLFFALTLLFASSATLVYASGAGESWLDPPTAGTAAPCPAPREAQESPKEMHHGSENRDPK
jgi:hypothetical protein